jgi:pimeloyl-ACP methyl ester carboxylesterase
MRLPVLLLGASAIVLLLVVGKGRGRSSCTATGDRFRYVEAGTGVGVVLEAGLGEDFRCWSGVWPAIGTKAHVLAYSRAGYRGSSSCRTPRSAQHCVAELRALLHARGIAPPYVLVGRCIGAMYMEYFARCYPDEVAGLVLIEPLQSPVASGALVVGSLTLQASRSLQSISPRVACAEARDVPATVLELRESPPLQPIPVVVVSSRGRGVRSGHAIEQLDAALARSLGGELVIAPADAHPVPRRAPQLVIRAVESVLSKRAARPTLS